MSVQPRPYQQQAGEAVAALDQEGLRKVLLVKATGLGKTVFAATLNRFIPQTGTTLFLAHREELVAQAAETFRWANPSLQVQIEMADRHAFAGVPFLIGSVQTLGRKGSKRLAKHLGHITQVIVDEAHHVTEASQYDRILRPIGLGHGMDVPQGKHLLGLTATPNRHDGLGLHWHFDDIVPNESVEPPERGWDLLWGIDNGYLVPIIGEAIETETDLSGVLFRGGDFAPSELSERVNNDERNVLVLKTYIERHWGQKALAFCVDIEHATRMAYQAKYLGIKAAAVHSDTKKHPMDNTTRKTIIRGFREGRIDLLCNVGIATEGFDVRDIKVILLTRPTESLPLYTQMIGRGTRPVINPVGATAEERREEIAKSDKSSIYVYDFTDKAGKHQPIVLPSLFGLEREFKYSGMKIHEIVKIVEEEAKKRPSIPIFRAKSLEEVEAMSHRLSILNVPEPSTDAKMAMKWWKMGGGRYHLFMPATDKAPTGEIIVHRDRLGRCATYLHEGTTSKKGKVYTNLQQAIAESEKYARLTRMDALELMLRKSGWHRLPATKNQKRLLYKLRVEGDIEGLSRGRASELIDYALNAI